MYECLNAVWQPLRSANLVDSDVPLWAKTFVDEIPPDLLADVVEGAEYLKTDMYVMWRSETLSCYFFQFGNEGFGFTIVALLCMVAGCGFCAWRKLPRSS
jgi:hypothetical protein